MATRNKQFTIKSTVEITTEHRAIKTDRRTLEKRMQASACDTLAHWLRYNDKTVVESLFKALGASQRKDKLSQWWTEFSAGTLIIDKKGDMTMADNDTRKVWREADIAKIEEQISDANAEPFWTFTPSTKDSPKFDLMKKVEALLKAAEKAEVDTADVIAEITRQSNVRSSKK